MKLHLKSLHYYLIVLGIFISICAPNLFSDGMFMDGLLYASIAKNMANGIGTFWYPHLTDTLQSPFHEHPPLAFGLQAIMFYLFGKSILIERFYSLSTFLISGLLISLIWKKITGDLKTGWIPLVLWIMIPRVSWACANNILENTMGMFLCAAVYFYLNSFERYRFLMIVFCGICLFLGFLSKGFTALYIWSIPFWLWICIRKRSFLQMTADSIVFVVSTIAPILLLFLFSADAFDSLWKYFSKQVLTSVLYTVRVSTRWYIVYRMITELLPLIVFTILVFGFYRFKSKKYLKIPKETPAFLLLGLSGVLPIMISMKQSGFYINTTYPFFAISFGLLIKPAAIELISYIEKSGKIKNILKILSYCVLAFSVILSATQVNRTGRDKEKLEMIYSFIKIIPENTVISIQKDLWEDWSLHGYFSRHANISLDPDEKKQHDFYLEIKSKEIIKNRNMTKIKESNGYVLYKIKK